jgi:hypothetical protein
MPVSRELRKWIFREEMARIEHHEMGFLNTRLSKKPLGPISIMGFPNVLMDVMNNKIVPMKSIVSEKLIRFIGAGMCSAMMNLRIANPARQIGNPANKIVL